MPERKVEAASAAELAVESTVEDGASETAKGGMNLKGGAATEPEEFAGINGVSAREREVESTRPHGAEERRTEAEESAPERTPEEGVDEELIIETIKRGCAD
jgi:hypothetical protein